MPFYLIFAAAEMFSDFAAVLIKPYAVRLQWIMSEKYKGVPVMFDARFVGMPAYITADNEYEYLDSYPESAGI